jgi:threonine/homoserine efflux transporter RhtA
VVLVTIGYAVGPQIISRRAMGVVAASLVLTALLYAPVGILLAPRTMPSMPVVASVVGLGVVCTALAFMGFFALIAEIGPVSATVIMYVNPAAGGCPSEGAFLGRRRPGVRLDSGGLCPHHPTERRRCGPGDARALDSEPHSHGT